MKVGEVREWLDQGPAIILDTCTIKDPQTDEEYLSGETVGSEEGVIIKVFSTGEILSVHEETLGDMLP